MKKYNRLFLVDGDSFVYKALNGIDQTKDGDQILIFVSTDGLERKLRQKGYVRPYSNIILVQPGKEAVDNRIKSFLGNHLKQDNKGSVFIVSHDHGFYEAVHKYRSKYGISQKNLDLKKSIWEALNNHCSRGAKKKNPVGNGYIGRSMSIHAKQAYERGLKPLSRITSADLKENGFFYPVRFFRWIVKNWDIKPKEMHHTSAACNITAFYDKSVIRYIASGCNLELLYRIYKGDITREQAIQERGIRYVRIQVLDKILGARSGNMLTLNGVMCDGFILLSARICIRVENPGVRIIEIFEDISNITESNTMERLTVDLIRNKTKQYCRYVKP